MPAPDNKIPNSGLRRRFLRLTAYNILANLTVPLTGLVDQAMLGHLDDIRFLAGVALATVIFDYLYWGMNFLRMGTTGTVAQAAGRGDLAETWTTLYRSLLLALVIGVLILASFWPIRELFFWIQFGENEVKQAGRAYFNMRIIGAPAVLCNFVILGWLLGREKPGLSLLITAAGNLGNVVLDYVFIYELHLAAAGAGLATALAQYLMLAIGLAVILAHRPPRPSASARILENRKIKRLIFLNVDIAVRTFCLLTAFYFFVNIAAKIGTEVLAVNTILHGFILLSAFLIDGPALAAEILTGNFLGQGDRTAVQRTVRYSFVFGFLLAGGFLLVFFAAPDFFIGRITHHSHILELSREYRNWLWPYLLLATGAYVFDGLFVGMTRGRELRNAMLISVSLGFFPAALAAYAFDSNHLLWGAMCLFALGRLLTLWYRFNRNVDRAVAGPAASK